jgi:hypothetical protein
MPTRTEKSPRKAQDYFVAAKETQGGQARCPKMPGKPEESACGRSVNPELEWQCDIHGQTVLKQ